MMLKIILERLKNNNTIELEKKHFIEMIGNFKRPDLIKSGDFIMINNKKIIVA